jgi:type I restriction enzyme, S subunit
MLLKDLLILTKDGEWGKGEPSTDLTEMFVIRGTDFEAAHHCSFSNVPIRYIPQKIAERKTLQPEDILIETAGGTQTKPTGRTVFLKPRLFEQSKRPITCASFSRFLRINSEIAVPEYIFWYLQFLYETGQMEQHQVQHTGVARFQYTKFAESVDIPLPPLSEQKAIAHILGTLDDKIELNRQMNETLEAMARAIFKSWFVDFDPVRAKMEGRQPAGMDAATADLFPDEFEESSLC